MMKSWKTNWIGHILRRTRYRRKDTGRIKVTGRRRKRSRLLLDDLKEKNGFEN
jgi:hypothetical protein